MLLKQELQLRLVVLHELKHKELRCRFDRDLLVLTKNYGLHSRLQRQYWRLETKNDFVLLLVGNFVMTNRHVYRIHFFDFGIALLRKK